MWNTAVSAQEKSGALRGMVNENDARAWKAVGRLDSEEVGFCTATLISSDLILTAAHCVYSADTKALVSLESLMFRSGLREETVAAERRIAQIEAHPGYDPSAELTLNNIRHDVALLRLAEPISTLEMAPFGVSQNKNLSGPLSVVSYGRGRESAPSRQDVCDIKAKQDDVIVMDCQATHGSSGAPVFNNTLGRGQIVSVISGGGTYNGQRIVYGMALPQVVAELKQKMWANKQKPVASVNRVKIHSGLSGARSTGAKFIRP